MTRLLVGNPLWFQMSRFQSCRRRHMWTVLASIIYRLLRYWQKVKVMTQVCTVPHNNPHSISCYAEHIIIAITAMLLLDLSCVSPPWQHRRKRTMQSTVLKYRSAFWNGSHDMCSEMRVLREPACKGRGRDIKQQQLRPLWCRRRHLAFASLDGEVMGVLGFLRCVYWMHVRKGCR